MLKKNDIDNFIPQILADSIILGLGDKLDFRNNNLITEFSEELAPGRVIEIPIRGRLGKFKTKAEGEAMDTDNFSTDKMEIIPEIKALQSDYTLEAAGGYRGDLENEIIMDLTDSAVDTITEDIYQVIKNVEDTDDYDKNDEKISYNHILKVIAKNRIKDRDKYTLIIGFDQLPEIEALKDENGNNVFKYVNDGESIKNGFQGYVAGIKVHATSRILPDDNKIESYLVEDGAVGVAWAESDPLNLDADIDKSKLTYSVYAHYLMGLGLLPNKTVQRMIFKEDNGND